MRNPTSPSARSLTRRGGRVAATSTTITTTSTPVSGTAGPDATPKRRRAGRVSRTRAPRKAIPGNSSEPALSTDPSAAAEDVSSEPAPARRVRKPGRLTRWLRTDGIEDRTILTSTRQAEAINPAVVATHPPEAGPPMALDMETTTALSCDPHLLYQQERITSLGVVVLGGIGTGKSTILKTLYGGRAIATGKQVAVFDRKSQQDGGAEDHGEYVELAQACGDWAQVFIFDRRRGAAINLLDPRIAAVSDKQTNAVGQDTLLRLAAEYAHGPLNSFERHALHAAHAAALELASREERVATIHDVIEALYRPDAAAVPRAHLTERGLVTADDVTRWGLPLAVDLERFVSGDLSGLIDGTTSDEVDWNAPLLVFDTSELEENSPALSLVMAVAATFLSSVWSKSGRRQRLILLEEGYTASGLASGTGVSVASIFRSLIKRGRGIGLSFVTAFHHISDVPADSDLMSLIREAGVVHIFRQERADDMAAALETFNIPRWVELDTLDRGEHVLKIGQEAPRLARGIRTAVEATYTNTDKAILTPAPVWED